MIRQIHNLLGEDFNLVEQMGKSFMSEGTAPCGFDCEKFMANWHMILKASYGTIFVLEIDGKIQGGLGGMLYPCLNDGALQAAHTFWFVSKKYRGTVHPGKLFIAFEKWSEKLGATRFLVSHVEKSMPQSVKKFYESRGYEMLETNFVKVIK